MLRRHKRAHCMRPGGPKPGDALLVGKAGRACPHAGLYALLLLLIHGTEYEPSHEPSRDENAFGALMLLTLHAV